MLSFSKGLLLLFGLYKNGDKACQQLVPILDLHNPSSEASIVKKV